MSSVDAGTTGEGSRKASLSDDYGERTLGDVVGKLEIDLVGITP